ncbi:protein SODIUM POTASSIUM ROOT DEFECTIVE 2 [Gastrolobium bilobum]|uniref:protein SODIUM POTASSIUM ROOT DEFECTIVE 2 n=1 Tax=Gastrolobium bilobum TaxID=150636 RepID=UPI002AB25C4E|nr:protein SODIUM POTASSIUM ROOT DEFECTIVE 2 [Gastrolobium bilobum]
MGKLGRMLGTFCFSSGSNACFCINSMEFEDEFEKKSLIASGSDHKLRLKDVVDGKQTLAFQLKPQIVILRVSMHCQGCARKVEKHISKLEGVTSYKVDLETKMVVVMGDILPFEVLESVSKVKNAEFWNSHANKE